MTDAGVADAKPMCACVGVRATRGRIHAYEVEVARTRDVCSHFALAYAHAYSHTHTHQPTNQPKVEDLVT